MGRASRGNLAVVGFDSVMGTRRGRGTDAKDKALIQHLLLRNKLAEYPGAHKLQAFHNYRVHEGAFLLDEHGLVRALQFGDILSSTFYLVEDIPDQELAEDPDQFLGMHHYDFESAAQLTQAASVSPWSSVWMKNALGNERVYEHAAAHVSSGAPIISVSGVMHEHYVVRGQNLFAILTKACDKEISSHHITQELGLDETQAHAHVQWLERADLLREDERASSHYLITPMGEHVLNAAKQLRFFTEGE
jgi:predicted transcriptional regulator